MLFMYLARGKTAAIVKQAELAHREERLKAAPNGLSAGVVEEELGVVGVPREPQPIGSRTKETNATARLSLLLISSDSIVGHASSCFTTEFHGSEGGHVGYTRRSVPRDARP